MLPDTILYFPKKIIVSYISRFQLFPFTHIVRLNNTLSWQKEQLYYVYFRTLTMQRNKRKHPCPLTLVELVKG